MKLHRRSVGKLSLMQKPGRRYTSRNNRPVLRLRGRSQGFFYVALRNRRGARVGDDVSTTLSDALASLPNETCIVHGSDSPDPANAGTIIMCVFFVD